MTAQLVMRDNWGVPRGCHGQQTFIGRPFYEGGVGFGKVSGGGASAHKPLESVRTDYTSITGHTKAARERAAGPGCGKHLAFFLFVSNERLSYKG